MPALVITLAFMLYNTFYDSMHGRTLTEEDKAKIVEVLE